MKYNHNISQEEFEEFERYLSEDMSSDEHEAFIARVNADPLLQEKLEETRMLLLGIRESALQSTLEGFHKELIPANHRIQKKKKFRMYWFAAASLIVVIAVATILLTTGGSRNEKLFARYFEADSGLVTAMGISEDYDFNRGMIDYKTGNYKAAIETWRRLAGKKPGNDTLHYFSGVAFLALDQADSAVYHLLKTVDLQQSGFRSDANWYIGLALLKQNKEQEAMSYIRQTTHPRKDELLSSLK